MKIKRYTNPFILKMGSHECFGLQKFGFRDFTEDGYTDVQTNRLFIVRLNHYALYPRELSLSLPNLYSILTCLSK